MKTILLFPPLSDPAQPYSALPALYAFLRERGRRDVLQMDVNIEFVRHLLTPEALEETTQWMARRGSGAEDIFLTEAALKAPVVAAGITPAVMDFKNPDCFKDPVRLSRAGRMVREAMAIHSTRTMPYPLQFHNPRGNLFATTAELTRRLGKHWDDGGENIFHDFFTTHTLPKLKKEKPGLIGISVTYQVQILPAFTLAALIKEHLPGTVVVMGGNIISLWHDTLEQCPDLFHSVDYFVGFEGETALFDLLGVLENNGTPDHVPNLVYRRGDKIIKNPVRTEDVNALPTPDYRGLPLDLYLSPQNVFLLYTSRGCYWAKCKFCAVSAAMGRSCRRRDAERIHGDIVTTVQRHQSPYVAFADDCAAPATLKALSARLNAGGPTVYWQCEVRFEATFTPDLLKEMRRAGCLNLIFGMESCAPGVLSKMDKGTKPELIRRIISDCRRNDIAINLQLFFGFPGETPEEAQLTADFIREQAHGGATFSFGIFELVRGSEVARSPEAFGLDPIEPRDTPLALSHEYSPDPQYARRIREQLIQDLYGGSGLSNSGLSITAHTLVFLKESGTAALGRLYEKKQSPTRPNGDSADADSSANDLMHRPLRAGARRSVKRFDIGGMEFVLLYDYDVDRMVEISPTVAWLLDQLDGSRTPHQLAQQLEKETDTQWPGHDSVAGELKELLRAGFLVHA